MLTAIETTALNNAVISRVAKTMRGQVGPGEYPIDMTVRIVGTMNVQIDTTKAPTVCIPPLETMALLLHRMGFQREKALELMREVFTEAIGTTGRGQGSLEMLPHITELKERIERELIANLPPIPVKGAVKTNFAIEQIGTTVS